MRYALEEVVYFELNKRFGRRFPEYTEENFGSQGGWTMRSVKRNEHSYSRH